MVTSNSSMFTKDVLDKNLECAGLPLVVDMYEKGYNTSTMAKRSHFKSKSCTIKRHGLYLYWIVPSVLKCSA